MTTVPTFRELAEKKCFAINCTDSATWKSKALSLHVKPKLVTTFWCAHHASLLRPLTRKSEWVLLDGVTDGAGEGK